MTLQERYDAIKTEAATLGQRHQQARRDLLQLEQNIIRADAQMLLLETLIADATAFTRAQPESDVT